jgi:hypothetical protein
MAQTSIQMGPIGIWTRQLEDHPAAKARETAHELNELGYGTLWFGEAAGREALTNADLLLARARRMVIATGIANWNVAESAFDAVKRKRLPITFSSTVNARAVNLTTIGTSTLHMKDLFVGGVKRL